ncbi:GNAT family N-acetyltransferase [Candidatus Woesearchaeota archaeon]|nr:GNAT family N-acetyltransferase [Candidatus Woesearchaeota archaeon]
MIIRNARKHDMDMIYRLYEEFEKEQIKLLDKKFKILRRKKEPVVVLSKKFLLSRILKKRSAFLVAEENKEIIGYIYGSIKRHHFHFDRPKTGSFGYLIVDCRYRYKGIASGLYTALKKWFKKNNCRFIELQVLARNPAVSIYKKWGFEPTNYIMRKKI